MKFIKKIFFVLCFIFIFVLGGCDNNEGPFELRKENGNLVLYSNNKPAKGWVVENNIDYTTGITVKFSEIEYNKGLPTGKFKFYNKDGILYLDANLKKSEIGYSGKLILGDSVLEGDFILNPDWIVSNKESFFYDTFINSVLYNGTLTSPTFGNFRYIKGLKNGPHKSYNYSNQLILDGEYIDGEFYGKFIDRDDYSDTIRIELQDGMRLYIEYGKLAYSGNIKINYYPTGVQEGSKRWKIKNNIVMEFYGGIPYVSYYTPENIPDELKKEAFEILEKYGKME